MGGKRLVSKRSNPLTLSPSKGVKYAIELTPAASREIRKLERLVQRRLVRLLEILAKDPRPRGVETMKSRERFLRVRVGDYRVVYRLDEARRVVLVLRVGHRREVYRGL